MSFWQHVDEQISIATGEKFVSNYHQEIAGGCINQTQKISNGLKHYFIKINTAALRPMFVTEALALQEISATNTVKVPDVICQGVFEQQSFLVLEYLTLSAVGDMCLLGEQLADMHQNTQAEFGWSSHNVIGSTEQINTPNKSWIKFWQTNRLGFQLALAEKNAYKGELLNKGERLLADMHLLFDNELPKAAMLHGDLWAGNAAALNNRQPVIYDPAFYYGDAEADIAMTELFGGFSGDFYAAYKNKNGLSDAYPVRKIFYNLYHIINHLNLFGGSYEVQSIQMMERLLSEV